MWNCIAYTSIANADTTGMKLAAEHQATEGLLKESGVPFAFLRNGWYLENYTEQLQGTLAQGALAGSAGEGKVSAASAADYAEAAAAVLVAENQAGKVYELGGDHAFTLDGAGPGNQQSGQQDRGVPGSSGRATTRASWLASVFRSPSLTSWQTRISALPAGTCSSAARTSAN